VTGQFVITTIQVIPVTGAYYVDANLGNDSNAGTLASPFKTIQKCANTASSGSICLMRAGIYRETLITNRDGITFMPYNNEDVTISALEILTGRVQSGAMRKAPMNWTMNDLVNSQNGWWSGMDQVFVDGQMMSEARRPNAPVTGYNAVTRSFLAQANS
jgi:hypothetical protein